MTNKILIAAIIFLFWLNVYLGMQFQDKIDELNAKLTIHYNELQEMKK